MEQPKQADSLEPRYDFKGTMRSFEKGKLQKMRLCNGKVEVVFGERSRK
jgi:hypothetical protein